MSLLSVNLHGPLTATSRTQVGSYGTLGIVSVRAPEGGVDLTIFAPSPEAGQAIAYAINAAWATPVSQSEAA